MKTAVIGIGAIAPLHIKALQACGQEIVALCDAEIEKCHAANEKFELSAAVYTDYLEMLDAVQPDVIHICTPHYLHAEMICAGLSRNIHVLCEKPLAISLAQLAQIEATVKSSSAQLGICFQNRFNPSVLYLKEYFADKKITAAYAQLAWKRDAAYYASGAWRGKFATEGGGVMINQMIHSLDLVQWFCGMPDTVLAHVSNNSLRDVVEVEDTAYGLFTLEDGSRFVLSATNTASFSFPVSLAFHAEKETAQLVGDNIILNGKFLTLDDGRPLFGKAVWGTGHKDLVADFYRCIREGEKFRIDFYEASKAIRLVLSMYRSEGKEIKVL